MVLSAQEELLISVIRALPPDEAGKMLNWARQLADLADGRAIQWSDSGADEDLADATEAFEWIENFQHCLGDVDFEAKIGCHHVRKTSGVFEVFDDDHHVRD